MSRSDRGGSAASDQIGLEMGSPPLPSASPPQGGRRGLIQRSPSGRIDGANAKQYEETLLERIAAGHTKILVNCEAVNYISSAGLRVLLMASRRAGEAAGNLLLCAVKDHVHDVFKYSGFAEIIPIHEDREAALESF